MRRLAAIVAMAPLAAGCLLELSPRPGTGVVRRATGTTMVVFVDASTESTGDAMTPSSADASEQDAGAENPTPLAPRPASDAGGT